MLSATQYLRLDGQHFARIALYDYLARMEPVFRNLRYIRDTTSELSAAKKANTSYKGSPQFADLLRSMNVDDEGDESMHKPSSLTKKNKPL